MKHKVLILMGTYNGAAYLREQLQSLKTQTYPHWSLVISDDGSCDETLRIVQEFQQCCGAGQVTIMQGPRQGFAANFLNLAVTANTEYDYYAYADQDDIWLPEKLERAIKMLGQFSMSTPGLYGSRTELVNAQGDHIGYSALPIKKPSFRNALAQSIAGGNTMVFNQALLRVLCEVGLVKIVSHDWWLYQVVMAVGGNFIFDKEASILYRQHGANLVGTNSTLKGKLYRAKEMLKGRYQHWMDINLAALQHLESEMLADNKEVFNMFLHARTASLPKRLYLLLRSGIRRQTLLGNCGLLVAGVLKRV